MTRHPFRFGVVAAQAQSGEHWAGLARRVESLGYATLLMPDNLRGLAPFPALTAAAAATTTLRVGPYVLAAPYRPPADVAQQTATLNLLSGNRFELGLGAGRPAAAEETATLERPFGTFAERLDQLVGTIRAVRALAPGTPLLVAGSGPRLLERLAPLADTIALGLGPRAGEDELAAAADLVRVSAGERADALELNVNVLAVGDDSPLWLRQVAGADAAELAAIGSAAVLTGSLEQMIDTLERRRERTGISYVATNPAFMDALAPLVERLAGR